MPQRKLSPSSAKYKEKTGTARAAPFLLIFEKRFFRFNKKINYNLVKFFLEKLFGKKFLKLFKNFWKNGLG